MQALQREIVNNNWIIILFILGLLLLFFMKIYNASRLLGYTISFLTIGYMKKRSEESLPFFSIFNLLLFAFSLLTFSLFLYLVNPYYETEYKFTSFLKLATFISIYIISKYFLETFIHNLLNISNVVRYFIFSKSRYLYSIAIWLFPILVIYFFSCKNNFLLWLSILFLFILRLVLVFYNNKKLILNSLFYFILYLCALEIAPLLILYKLLI